MKISSIIPGAAMFAPMVNPYDTMMTKEERRGTWEKWTRKRKFMYFLARRFPSFLAYFYHQSFLSGKHGQIDKWLSLSLGKRVRHFIINYCFQIKISKNSIPVPSLLFDVLLWLLMYFLFLSRLYYCFL